MASTQEISRRIKSIRSTKKVTKAMQMVSASKMRKAQSATLASRTYAGIAWDLIRSLSSAISATELESKSKNDGEKSLGNRVMSEMTDVLLLLSSNNFQATKILVIVISSNRGLVGNFNSNLFKKLKEVEEEADKPCDYIVLGRKIGEMASRSGKSVIADFSKPEGLAITEDIYPVAKLVGDKFTNGKYRQVLVVYNHFVSTLSQQVRVKRLLPFDEPSDVVYAQKKDTGGNVFKTSDRTEYLFEPSPSEVLVHLLPRILESQLYQCLLESDASEHSSRMVMMKNATEAAEDIVSDLTLTYNQLRQNRITTELSEITAGRIALES